ncbi:DNA-damage-inducible protein D [Chitinophaga skermanii]|uniref:DNA-damage-inducible protein D n=1 Tax=Chitinophaga skermanii TaxID=331697 RepID=A0A327Q657_9BACT|nr:hypothetical protein [Chitinophaga skermanii]RAI99770.1 DNA-damage-inducible protein D [Chitinophaga skermanii]
MLKIYEYLDEVLSVEHFNLRHEPLEYYASEVMEKLGYNDNALVKTALFRAMEACVALQYPVSEHFKKTFCSKDGHVSADWQMSILGCYFLIINCDPSNPNVAKAQLFAWLQGGRKKVI